MIRKATSSEYTTFLTRDYGRGTNFVVRDPTVKSNDGVHVLKTFWTHDKSEEVQIKGRTGREG